MLSLIRLIAVVILFAFAPIQNSAKAGFVQTSYAEYVKSTESSLTRIAVAGGLRGDEIEASKKTAASFFLIGPCMGSIHGNNSEKYSSILNESIPSVISFDVNNEYARAIMTMIGYLSANGNLGRKPPEYTCRFSAETAMPYIPSGITVTYCFARDSKGEESCESPPD